MGNTNVANCGCFDFDADRLKESNCFDARNKSLSHNSILIDRDNLYTNTKVNGGTGAPPNNVSINSNK